MMFTNQQLLIMAGLSAVVLVVMADKAKGAVVDTVSAVNPADSNNLINTTVNDWLFPSGNDSIGTWLYDAFND